MRPFSLVVDDKLDPFFTVKVVNYTRLWTGEAKSVEPRLVLPGDPLG
jgi:hypothetical protein